MKGILFGNYHSFRDLQMILSEKEIGAPPVKKEALDIPGGDGELDFTEFFGEPKYGNVTHKFTFTTIQKDLLTQYSTVKNALHGKKVRIVLDDDPTFFYMGRCEVSSFHDEHGVGTIVITCDCEPYKYSLDETVVSKAMGGGTSTVILTNGRKRVIPTITTDTETTISFGTYTGTFNAGTHVIPELQLVEGDNAVKVRGTGNVSFSYRKGVL